MITKWHNFCPSCQISINIQHGGSWLCFQMHPHCLLLNRQLYVNMGEIGVACYFWMTLYMSESE